MIFEYRQRGISATEYAVILSLLSLLGIGALKLLGTNNTQLLNTTSQTLASRQVQNYLRFHFGSTDPAISTGAPSRPPSRMMQYDPATGELTIVTSSATNPTNATSTDGAMLAGLSYGTATDATQLTKLIPRLSDPAVKAWAKDISNILQYLASSSGSYAGLSNMTPNSQYSKANALIDTSIYQSKLEAILNNFPKNGDPAEIRQVMALATDAWSNAQYMTDRLNTYHITGSESLLAMVEAENGCNGVLNCSRGSLMPQGVNIFSLFLNDNNYKKLMSRSVYNDKVIRNVQDAAANVDAALATGAAEGQPVLQSTLLDASTLNQATDS